MTSIKACEFKPLPYLLLVTNLILHGVEVPDVYPESALDKRLSDYTAKDCVDRIAMNPPYGGMTTDLDKQNFPADMRSSETFDLFIQLIIKRLAKGGKAIVVLPDGFLFGTDNIKVNIKKKLLSTCNLHTVIRLPNSCFAPYTSIATNLLFFDKTGPTEETWFYRLDMPDGYKHFSKTKPMKREHFAPVDGWWDNRVEIKDEKEDESHTETWKSRKYSIKEIEQLGYNIDLCGYPQEQKTILSPEETIQTFIEKRNALDAQMDAKLKEILELLGVK
jgi:type I restriction enzyme M protein